MRNTIGKLCVIFATLLLLFAVAFFTVSLILRDSDYFEQQYKERNVSELTGISTPDLSRATNTLLEYMRGERANIRVEARKNGENIPDLFFRYFSERSQCFPTLLEIIIINGRYIIKIQILIQTKVRLGYIMSVFLGN